MSAASRSIRASTSGSLAAPAEMRMRLDRYSRGSVRITRRSIASVPAREPRTSSSKMPDESTGSPASPTQPRSLGASRISRPARVALGFLSSGPGGTTIWTDTTEACRGRSGRTRISSGRSG